MCTIWSFLGISAVVAKGVLKLWYDTEKGKSPITEAVAEVFSSIEAKLEM